MITIRTATTADQEPLGRFGGALMRQHHDADPRRFLQVEHPEEGYGAFLVSQVDGRGRIVMVAEDEGAVVGYVYATLEPMSWPMLRGPCGAVQDLYVDPAARRRGAGRALLEAALAWIRKRGRGQVVLMTMTGNVDAQRLFAAHGFRPTMLEMTLDLERAGG